MRNYRRGYYKVKELSEQGKPILWGAEIYHAYNCGKFVQDGEEYYLFFCVFVREVLPDTQGQNQETLDMDMATTDRLAQNPFWQGINAGIPFTMEDLQFLPLSVQGLIEQDLEQGLTHIEIFELRSYCLVNDFMGFTLQEVIERFPEILQPTKGTDEDGKEYQIDNIKRCSLEKGPQ